MLLEGLGGSLEESGSDYDSDDDFDRVQRDDLGIYLLYRTSENGISVPSTYN